MMKHDFYDFAQMPHDYFVPPIGDSDFGNIRTNDLLAEASHELRTPLASIQNSILLLRLRELGTLPPDVEDVLQVVERNANRLISLVESILVLEHLNHGITALDLNDVELDRLIRETIDLVQAEATKKCLKVEFAGQNISIQGDRQRLTQVVLNLLSNAIKFSPAHESVEIAITVEADGIICISIADRGPGVAAQDRRRIFGKFEQGTSGLGRGTGLGLNIAKRIVEHHGGKIGVSGRAGGGTIFWIRLRASIHSSIESPDSNQAA